MLTKDDIKEFLDHKVLQFNRPDFIELDPISIPHRFTSKEDVEISAFLTATISWGNRKAILSASDKMMKMIGESPYEFIMDHNSNHLKRLSSFYYRTFNGTDFIYFIKALNHIYKNHGGLEHLFNRLLNHYTLQQSIGHFKKVFFELPHQIRTEKHISDPLTGSAAKRINMMLRWLVRDDNSGVDFGLWKQIKPAILSCPLDIHSGNTARKLGLLKRKQNDAKSVFELDGVLRDFDPIDPVKYDFALFGLGVKEKF